jgi:ABC-2 type transport system permease protein
MKTLYKKELSYYLNNPLGYIIVVLFAVFANFFYIKDIFVIGEVSMKDFLAVFPWLFLVFVPAITMRIISEEKKNNTLETLLSLPVSEAEIVTAKFLALLTVTAVAIGLTLGLPIALIFVSKLYILEVIIGYIGLLFMGAFFIALSMFFSTQTKNQVIALLLSVIAIFFLIIINSGFNAAVLPKFLQDSISYFSPTYHLQNFVKGILDIRSIFYFTSATALFLFLTVLDLEKRD